MAKTTKKKTEKKPKSLMENIQKALDDAGLGHLRPFRLGLISTLEDHEFCDGRHCKANETHVNLIDPETGKQIGCECVPK